MLEFLLTRPSRGATLLRREAELLEDISTHTPLAGRDSTLQMSGLSSIFLLTRPSRGATSFSSSHRSIRSISTHTPLAGREDAGDNQWNRISISTHTPLAGRDRGSFLQSHAGAISTHTPLAGRDKNTRLMICLLQQFLLTRPSRGATKARRRT